MCVLCRADLRLICDAVQLSQFMTSCLAKMHVGVPFDIDYSEDVHVFMQERCLCDLFCALCLVLISVLLCSDLNKCVLPSGILPQPTVQRFVAYMEGPGRTCPWVGCKCCRDDHDAPGGNLHYICRTFATEVSTFFDDYRQVNSAKGKNGFYEMIGRPVASGENNGVFQ